MDMMNADVAALLTGLLSAASYTVGVLMGRWSKA